jgi:two-component system sensor histidine kinase PilS (NtrC family)
MLCRLVILAGFTVLAAVVFYAGGERYPSAYMAAVWTTLALGYALTIVWAWALPRVRDVGRLAGWQTAVDILFAAVAIHLTGGVASGFATLYLIAVLGAATMGGARQTWTAAVACTLVLATTSSLEFTGWIVPRGDVALAPHIAADYWGTVARTVAGLLGVTVLSSYLNSQLTRSVSQVGNLRALNENIARSLSSGLLTTDLEGRVLYFNAVARVILDLDDAQIGNHVAELLPGIDTDEEASRGRQDVELTTAAGRAIHVGLTRSPLIDADGGRVGYLINFQDVTRLHDLAEQVRRNERLAAVGALAASVAHEIRNPLAAISGSAELLSGAGLGDEDGRLLRIIGRESTRLDGLVSDLLAFTRPRTPQMVPVYLHRAVREGCDAFRADPKAKGIDVQCEVEDEPLTEIDPAQLSQVLWNLMRNAAEAMQGSGRLLLRIRADDERAYIDVSDDGQGIVAEHLDSIFDPFFTTKEEGTGFGLAIVHRVVEDNGGRISATSEPGSGSTFTLSFPLIETDRSMAEDSGVLELGLGTSASRR